jgi:capsular exopolysaccharide synthesis family protein
LVIFSAGPGEGKSTTLNRLARLMAANGERILLVDSDLRRPTQHRLLGRPRQPGLSELLVGQGSLDEIVQHGVAPRLDFLPAGSVPGFTLGLVHAARLRELLSGLKGRYDKVFFDSPPIIGVSDASVLVSVADGAVLLIQHRRNPRAMVQRARQIVEERNTPLVGVVLNQVPSNAGEDYGYYTRNYDYYSESVRSGGGQPGRSADPSSRPDRIRLREDDRG